MELWKLLDDIGLEDDCNAEPMWAVNTQAADRDELTFTENRVNPDRCDENEEYVAVGRKKNDIHNAFN